MAEQLEKVISDLKKLNPDELNRAWGFALGMIATRDTDSADKPAA